MTCVTVHHQAMPTADGHVAVMRIGCILKDAETITTSRFCVTLTPGEARRMAAAMRSSYGHFLKEDGGDTVEVLCKEHEDFLWCQDREAFQITWTHKDGEEVCEHINCCEGADGDGWSWEFAQVLEEAADKAEEGGE